MRSSLSTLEKNFQTQSTFKRNTRYYNAPEEIAIEKRSSLIRRRPISTFEETDKLQNSFTDSTTALTSRVEEQTGKFRRRVSLHENIPRPSDYERQYSSPSSPKLRTFKIEKQVSRDYLNSVKIKNVEDERMFNNFKIEKPILNQTCDFSKLKGRNLDLTAKHMNDLYHESKKGFEYCFYKDSTTKTKVNYSLENKERKRYFFRPMRPENLAATTMNPEKVDNGLKIASNFKGRNIRQDGIPDFYLTAGRELPCQSDMRSMNELTNYYKGKDGRIEKPHVDYTVKKMREDLLNQRKEQHERPKKPVFSRQDVCDERYFRINKIGK